MIELILNGWPLLLPIAAFSGWSLARRKDTPINKKSYKPSQEYFLGLNYLLNEQPDKAVDVFIKLLEVDSETVETHLALGSLFRRRGETDRAIRIHQNLIARPQLLPHQKVAALMALGQDYMHAGFFDRAEKIFEDLAKTKGKHQVGSLEKLIELYQREKAWKECIETSKKLESIADKALDVQVAHYYCECAELSLSQNNYSDAYQYLKNAFQSDKNSARASLLLGKLEQNKKNYKAAIKAYKQIKKQDPDYLSEVIDPLIFCYQQIKKETECVEYFKETMQKYPRVPFLFFLASQIKQNIGIEEALDFLAEQLEKNPSVKGLNQLIAWHLETTYGKVRTKLQVLYDMTNKLLSDKPIYRCLQCGFGGKHLHWLCPSCKEWSTMKPIHGLEGD
jgi:lipopolysaccharide biosynthesis regulator YciM